MYLSYYIKKEVTFLSVSYRCSLLHFAPEGLSCGSSGHRSRGRESAAVVHEKEDTSAVQPKPDSERLYSLGPERYGFFGAKTQY